ncbi:MAG: bifunctional phosphoribosylaminoimidazolecarboxamide formyltransferase/IMP cyclohydrolase [Actinobacteria bacterium]|nr:bifunctional phosphoribosylaminoimidazolecarboxamide formyltransferase/IMP cyclohydrolase [Actinomycetota bacterium]
MEVEPVRRALISVSNKAGVVGLARELRDMGVEIISTGGTEAKLREEGIEVTPISEVTGFPEMLGGRVKTLHPNIHAALLARRDDPQHLREMEEMGIKPIDLVVVNLYPFAETVSRPETTLEEAVEQIDIGGVTLIRAAAKNFSHVAVVTNPKRYSSLLLEMRRNGGAISLDTRRALAAEAFRHTAEYDSAIFAYLSRTFEEFPATLNMVCKKKSDLRYGENPHQKAALYQEIGAPSTSLVFAEQLHGKELSFNNVLDLDAAWALVKEFELPGAAIIKHNNPCGAAMAERLSEAYRRAFECDPVSAFGSVIAFNRPVDEETAARVNETFVEAVIAPAFPEAALAILRGKEDIRLLQLPLERDTYMLLKDVKRVEGGLLVQDYDRGEDPREEMLLVGDREPTEEQWEELIFAWKVCRHVRSNAIVLTRGRATVGIGAGQMSRVDATRVALMKAGDRARGSVLASDAFFPFPDSVILAAEAGVEAFIQPGGSVRDEEIFEEVKKRGLVMVLTGKRHFRH